MRELTRAYVEQAVFALDRVKYEKEIAALPRGFTLPHGELLLALHGGRAVGCVAMRRFDGRDVEMKRLYVRPEARRSGAGAALVEAIVEVARENGYARMVLDTYRRTPAAIALYEAHGFVEIPAYCRNPEPDTVYFARDLRPTACT